MIKHSSILALILLIIPLSGMGIDVYAPSLPAIASALNAHHSLVKLSISIYLFGFSIGQLFTGPLSDSFGRRKILLVGLLSFMAFSLGAAFSKNIQFLLTMRLLQGLSVTAPVVIAKSVATDVFKGNQLRKASTYLVAAWSIGPIIAPCIGGHLQHWFGWQANFYFLALYSIAIFALVYIWLPETNQNQIEFNIQKIKLNYLEILSSKIFIGSAICLAIGYSQIAVFHVVGPFFIQKVLNFSAVDYGHIALTLGFACFLGSLGNRYFISKFSQEKIITSGIFIMLAASLMQLFLSQLFLSNLYLILPSIFLIMFCVGFVYPNCSAICLSKFPHIAGSASAIMGVITIMGTASMTSIASVIGSSNFIPLSWLYLFLAVSIIGIYFFMVKEKFFPTKEVILIKECKYEK